MTFSIIDVVFVGLIGLFIIRCYLKGFVSEFLSLAGIVLGLLAALFLYKNGGEFIRNKFLPDMDIVPEVLAFIIIFVLIFIIVKVLEKMLIDIIDTVSLTKADGYIGIIFGLAEGIAVISLLLFLLRLQPLFDPDPLLSDSFFARILLPFITGKETGADV
ncbi:MAG: CvpA family protein [Treponema sp.]|nr:CvpA family protein [Treponema sp.]